MSDVLAGGAGVHGTLDFVRNIRGGTVEQGRLIAAGADSLLVEGWALRADGPVEGVLVLVDGMPIARMVTHINRPDLPAAFGEGTDYGGYRGVVSLRPVSAGEHDLVVAAGSTSDGFAEIGRRRLLVTEPASRRPGAHLTLETDGWTGQAYLGEQVVVPGRIDRGAPAYDDVAAIVDDRHVVHGRFLTGAAAGRFEVVLSSEQFGLGTVQVRLAAFVGSERYDARDTATLCVSLDLGP